MRKAESKCIQTRKKSHKSSIDFQLNRMSLADEQIDRDGENDNDDGDDDMS